MNNNTDKPLNFSFLQKEKNEFTVCYFSIPNPKSSNSNIKKVGILSPS